VGNQGNHASVGSAPREQVEEVHCPFCEQPTTELQDEKGYAILWDEVHKKTEEYKAQGMTPQAAAEKAINEFIIWVTGSEICKIKTQAFVRVKFWQMYSSYPDTMTVRDRVEATTKDLCKYFMEKYPNSWKCFCGRTDFEKKVKQGTG
jgi:hypothetical protein